MTSRYLGQIVVYYNGSDDAPRAGVIVDMDATSVTIFLFQVPSRGLTEAYVVSVVDVYDVRSKVSGAAYYKPAGPDSV